MAISELEYDEPGALTRIPPQDLHAEQSVLGGMMLSKDAIADAHEVLRSIDFYRPAHESIYDAITDLYGRGEPVDAITVADELLKRGDLGRIGGQAYLHELIQSVPTAANAGYYAEIVAERAVLRRLVSAGEKIVQTAYAANGTVEDIVNDAQATIYNVVDQRGSEDYHALGTILEATLDEIEFASSHSGKMVGVPTGFTDLDTLTNGLHPGQMIVVAARPAVGKSTLGLDIARSAAIKHQLATVVFSLEMSRTEITMRLLSAEAGVPLQDMRKGTVREEHWQRIAQTTGRVTEAPLYIDDSPNMSLMEIRAKCRRLKQRHNLKLVIIDYLQLMSSGKRVESRQQEVSEFSRALKLLAKELEVPVIAISQLNRGPEQRTDKKPQMSDLRESGCLSADTRILRADTGAEVTIGELVASGERDVPVWALDESLRYVIRHLTHAFATGHRPVFRLTTRSGKSVRATANHPFMTYDGWTQLDELTVGTRIAVPRHTPAPSTVAALSEDEIAEVVEAVTSGAVSEIPTRVFTAYKAQIARFLQLLWEERGEIHPGGEPHPVIYLSLANTGVSQGVARLLLRFGISTEIAEWGGGLALRETDDVRRFLQEIAMPASSDTDAHALLAVVRERTAARSQGVKQELDPMLRTALDASPSGWAQLGRVATVLDHAEMDLQAVNDVIWEEVASIEMVGLADVYDATVVGGHNFIANGIAVHNSIEQDADMVILLHRESLYEKDSAREGEADLIVAKHRNGPTDTIVLAFQGHLSRFANMASNF